MIAHRRSSALQRCIPVAAAPSQRRVRRHVTVTPPSRDGLTCHVMSRSVMVTFGTLAGSRRICRVCATAPQTSVGPANVGQCWQMFAAHGRPAKPLGRLKAGLAKASRLLWQNRSICFVAASAEWKPSLRRTLVSAWQNQRLVGFPDLVLVKAEDGRARSATPPTDGWRGLTCQAPRGLTPGLTPTTPFRRNWRKPQTVCRRRPTSADAPQFERANPGGIP